MKRLSNILACTAVALFGLLASCSQDNAGPSLEGRPKVFGITGGITSADSVRLGTVITLSGVNMNQITEIWVGDMKASYSGTRTAEQISFIVPADPSMVQLVTYQAPVKVLSDVSRAGECVWEKADFYIYVEITNAFITSFDEERVVIGQTVEVGGYNLDKVSQIRFTAGGVTGTVSSDEITLKGDQYQTGATFKIPDALYPAGNAACTVSYVWGTGASTSTYGSPVTVRTVAPAAFTAPALVTPDMTLAFTGVNLDLISKVNVKLASGSTVAATIVTQDEGSITVTLPALASFGGTAGSVVKVDVLATPTYTTTAAPAALCSAMDVTLITSAAPVSFTPETGTIGTAVTITGKGLTSCDYVELKPATGTAIQIAKAAFTSVSATQIVFALPDAAFPQGESTWTVSCHWADSGFSGTNPVPGTLTIQIPKPDAFTNPTPPPAYTEKVTFTGEHMDLITVCKVKMAGGVSFGAVIIEKTPTSIVVELPADIYLNKGSATTTVPVDIYGYVTASSANPCTLCTGLPVDITKEPDATEPLISSVIPADGGTAPYKYYLKKTVTVTGTFLDNISKISFGPSIEATITSQTASKIVFSVPTNFTHTTAEEFDLIFWYGLNTKSKTWSDKAMVYPFCLWKDVIIYSSAYTDRSKTAFLDLETGRQLNSYDWATENFDAPAKTYNTATSSTDWTKTQFTTNNAIDISKLTKEQYYAVNPYMYCEATSSNSVFRVCGPANSMAGLRIFTYNTADRESTTGSTRIIGGSGYSAGTPVMMYRNISTETTNAGVVALAASLVDGSATSLTYPGSNRADGGTYSNITPTASEGKVIMMAWYKYQSTAPSAWDQVVRNGYFVVREVGGFPGGVFSYTTAYLKVDVYWPATDYSGLSGR